VAVPLYFYSTGAYKEGKAFDAAGKTVNVYESTLKQIIAGDYDSDFERLRMAFTITANYDPYNSDKKQDNMYEAFKNKKYEDAIKLGKVILEKEYVDMDAHRICLLSYGKIGDKKLAEHHWQVYSGLLNSVLNSGDGKSPESAYRVIKVREEYILLNEQGYEVEKQSLVSGKLGNCDLMEIKDTKTGEKLNLYFNVKISMDFMLNVFKKLNEKKE